MEDRLVTLAIHTLEYAKNVSALLEAEGIKTELNNINLDHPVIAPGVRIRIKESDLPLALRIVENREILQTSAVEQHDESRTILVPTDFSEHSLKAALLAFRLAARHQTDITLLHAYINPNRNANIQLADVYNYEAATQSDAAVAENAHQQMETFISNIKDAIKKGDIPPVKFRTVLFEGVPEDIINKYANQHHPFIIVMGTREAIRKERELVGSVTAELLDGCRHTVISIPAQAPVNDFRNISESTFFCNLDQSDILALDTLRRISDGNRLAINLVYISHRHGADTQQAVKNLLEYCNTHFPDYNLNFKQLTPDNITLPAANTLIVVPNKRKNIISRLFNPSLAHRLLFQNDIPMMVIPV